MLISQILKTRRTRANETMWYDGAKSDIQDQWAIIQFFGARGYQEAKIHGRVPAVCLQGSEHGVVFGVMMHSQARFTSFQHQKFCSSRGNRWCRGISEHSGTISIIQYGCLYCVHNHVTPGTSYPIDSMNAHMWLQAIAYGPIMGAFVELPGWEQCSFALDCGVTTLKLW
jgi:hypothetical protein